MRPIAGNPPFAVAAGVESRQGAALRRRSRPRKPIACRANRPGRNAGLIGNSGIRPGRLSRHEVFLEALVERRHPRCRTLVVHLR